MKSLFIAPLVCIVFIGCTTEIPKTVVPSTVSTEPKGGEAEFPHDETAANTSSSDATDVFANAMKQAADDDKRVLVHLGAPW